LTETIFKRDLVISSLSRRPDGSRAAGIERSFGFLFI
jgi:hypothetical protein